MKTAIVLLADTVEIPHHTGQINTLLTSLAADVSNTELWWFHSGPPPEVFPELSVPVSKIQLADYKAPAVPELFLSQLAEMQAETPVDLFCFAGNEMGNELAVRLGHRLGGDACSGVTSCRLREGQLIITKSAYGHNLNAELLLKRRPCCLAPGRITAKTVPFRCYRQVPRCRHTLDNRPSPWIDSISLEPETGTDGLTGAERVLAIGAGMGRAANLPELQQIAKVLGAQLGFSRPVVMNGWAGMDRLIGASGAILQPALCLAAGASGMGAFCVGIENSEWIAAINTDENAPIFNIADVGVVDDLFAVLNALAAIIKVDSGDKAIVSENGTV